VFSHCDFFLMFCTPKTHQICIYPTIAQRKYYKRCTQIVTNFNLGHKQQLGKSMDYKISSMGNTMHHLHEGGMFLHDLSQVSLILTPWKIETPFAPKLMNLEARLDSKSSSICNIFAKIILLKLVAIPPLIICSNVSNYMWICFQPSTT